MFALFCPNNLPSSTSSTKEQTHAFLKITAHTPRKNGYILTYSIDIRNIKLITFLMYFQFCVAFLGVQFLGLYSSQCTFILLLMLSMTTNFFIMYMLMTHKCIALLLPIKLIHYLTKFLHQPMTPTYGCQQTNLK